MLPRHVWLLSMVVCGSCFCQLSCSAYCEVTGGEHTVVVRLVWQLDLWVGAAVRFYLRLLRLVVAVARHARVLIPPHHPKMHRARSAWRSSVVAAHAWHLVPMQVPMERSKAAVEQVLTALVPESSASSMVARVLSPSAQMEVCCVQVVPRQTAAVRRH